MPSLKDCWWPNESTPSRDAVPAGCVLRLQDTCVVPAGLAVGSSGPPGAAPAAGRPQDSDERGDPCPWCGAPREMRKGLHPSTWIVAVTRGTFPTTPLGLPCPVTSFPIFT